MTTTKISILNYFAAKVQKINEITKCLHIFACKHNVQEVPRGLRDHFAT